MDCRDRPGNDDGGVLQTEKARSFDRAFSLLRCFEIEETAGLAFPEHGIMPA